METLYLGCLTLGVLFAIVTALLGDAIGDALDGIFDFMSIDLFNPTVLAGAITVFGGAGVLLTRYSGLEAGPVAGLAVLIAAFMGMLMYFGFVRTANRSEVSTGFSMAELPGKIGEITVPVPESGFGEVMVRVGAGNSLHTAASFEQRLLPAGERVVVVDIRDGVALVSQFEDSKGADT